MTLQITKPAALKYRPGIKTFDDIARIVVGGICGCVLREQDVNWPNSGSFETFPLVGGRVLGATHHYPFRNPYPIRQTVYKRAMFSEALVVNRYEKKLGIGRAIMAMGGSFKAALRDAAKHGPVLAGDVEGWFIFDMYTPDGLASGYTTQEIRRAVREETNRELGPEDFKEVEGFAAVRLF
ncbi:MAG TPA: hypothetical protein P5511_10355 [Candidatus Goldiibacteriota bacterium]|nr:hypothetical protein [Candidatus Goldiibacteriota bacterium]